MENMCERLGADISLLKFEWGKTADIDSIKNNLDKNSYDIVAVVHAETSTGVRNDIEQISQYIDGDTIFIVDAVTSLGTIDVNVDACKIDAIYSCSQKGLSCPPGASPISFSSCPSFILVLAAANFTIPSARTRGCGIVSPPILKFSNER